MDQRSLRDLKAVVRNTGEPRVLCEDGVIRKSCEDKVVGFDFVDGEVVQTYPKKDPLSEGDTVTIEKEDGERVEREVVEVTERTIKTEEFTFSKKGKGWGQSEAEIV